MHPLRSIGTTLFINNHASGIFLPTMDDSAADAGRPDRNVTAQIEL